MPIIRVTQPTGTTSSTPPAAPSPATVKEAEKLLRVAGFNPGKIDGQPTPAFDQSLRDFQKAWGLPVSGQPDAATMKKLRHTGKRIQAHRKDFFVSVGQKSKSIETLEKRLKLLGYDTGAADGVFSRQTFEAVKAFKADQKNLKNSSGAVGKASFKVLRQEVAALRHAPERRRLKPTKAQARIDMKTAQAVAQLHADGTVGLGRGAKSSRVANIQKHLKAAGFDPRHTTGVFDERTEAMVKVFQKKSGLDATGRVDTATWKALKKSYLFANKAASPAQALNERSAAVKRTEQWLARAGLNPGKVDGLFDNRTLKAVRAFEKKHHLTVDGQVTQGELARIKKAAGGVHVTPAMRRLARAAKSVALSMGGYRGTGYCATGVSRAIARALHLSVHGNGNQIDNNLPKSKFRQVHMPLSKALKIPGLILTWESTTTEAGKKYGHTAITLGDGHTSASDFVDRYTASTKRFGLKIFVPVV